MSLVRSLRNVPVRRFIAALEKDGFARVQGTIGSHRIYLHVDDRVVVIAYHRGGDTLPLKTLQRFLRNTGWDAEDVRRLKLQR